MIPELKVAIRPGTDNPRHLYREIFRTLEGSKEHRLSEEGQMFLLLARFDAEVRNGGFSQFFTNSSGKSYAAVLRALETLGLLEQRDLMQKFLLLLPPTLDPADREAVGAFIFGKPATWAASREFDQAYYAARDGFVRRLATWAIE